MRQSLLAAMAATILASSTLADGLIYKLPPDGSWATFEFVTRLTDVKSLKGEAMPDMEASGTLTLRSVGVGTAGKEPARWIELEYKKPPADNDGRIIALKALIPNSKLARNADPLKNISELRFMDRDWPLGEDPKQGVHERIKDAARIAYEIERLRKEFPFPPAKPVIETPASVLKTPLRTFNARKISYPTIFEGKLAGGKGGRWGWKGEYSLWLSDDAPFGVVAVEIASTGQEEYATADRKGVFRLDGEGVRYKTRMRLELAATGTGAKSAFPADKALRHAKP